jgi:hypothetical protein
LGRQKRTILCHWGWVTNVLVCESCQLAKSNRFPFTPSSRHFNDYEALTAFIKFKCFVENKFPTKIKAFQFDGGGREFTSNQIKHLLESNGIIHKISCPYTSQQNGIAKRKYRHLVETELASTFSTFSSSSN